MSRATEILHELELPMSYPKWIKSIIRFAQRGKWQIALCFCVGLFAFPLFLAYLVVLLLWRLIKGKVESKNPRSSKKEKLEVNYGNY